MFFLSLQASPRLLPLLAVVALVWLAVGNAQALGGAGELVTARGLQQVWLLLLAAVVVVKLMFKNGRRLVDTPNLRPELSTPWLA